MERELIREQVRAVLLERLAPQMALTPPVPTRNAPPLDIVSWRRFDDREHAPRRALVTEADVMRARSGSKSLPVPRDAIVTPLARETAARLGVTLEAGFPKADVQAPTKSDDAAAPAPSSAKRSVALAADHGGFGLKQLLKSFVAELGFDVLDLGTDDSSPVDYPDFAHQVADAISSGRTSFGIMVDGVGVGSAMAANRHRGIRAAPCSTTLQAHSAREHNDANVLTLGGRHLGEDAAKAVVKEFLETPFGGGRHVGRIEKIETRSRGG